VHRADKDFLEIWEPQSPGTPGPVQACTCIALQSKYCIKGVSVHRLSWALSKGVAIPGFDCTCIVVKDDLVIATLVEIVL
jgi:hypothetical protein